MCKYIAQKDSKGCAVACIAMVTGYDYDYVKSYFSGKDFTVDGMTFFSYVEFLVDHGFSCNWKWQNTQAKGINQLREIWPPELWADKHIVTVQTQCNNSHALVMLKDGTILDPFNKNVKSLDGYKEITQVIGIYSHA